MLQTERRKHICVMIRSDVSPSRGGRSCQHLCAWTVHRCYPKQKVERPVTLCQCWSIYQQQAVVVLSMFGLSGLKGMWENAPSRKTKNGRNE